MKVRLVTAGVGAAWEAALVRACQAGQVGAQVLHRCYDLSDLLAVASAGQAEVAMVAAGTRWLDRDALARLATAGLAVVGVVADGDEDSERRLRQLGLLHVASDADPPDALVDRARAALDAGSGLDHPDPTGKSPDLGEAPIEPDGDGRRILAAVWGPKGGPGRTTVAVNLAFEAAAAGGEVLLVDADTYGGAVAHATIQEHHRKLAIKHGHPGLQPADADPAAAGAHRWSNKAVLVVGDVFALSVLLDLLGGRRRVITGVPVVAQSSIGPRSWRGWPCHDDAGP